MMQAQKRSLLSKRFFLDKDEPLYGLGILQNGKMSQRNQTKRLVQGNVEDVVPFVQSVKGYGLFWDNYSPTNFADKPEGTSFQSEVGDCIDYYFMYGGDADGVVAQMRALTGQVPMFPSGLTVISKVRNAIRAKKRRWEWYGNTVN